MKKLTIKKNNILINKLKKEIEDLEKSSKYKSLLIKNLRRQVMINKGATEDLYRNFGQLKYELTKNINTYITDYLDEEINSLFENMDFVKKLMEKNKNFIQRQIRHDLSKSGVHSYVNSLVKQKLEQNINPLTNNVINKHIDHLIKKYGYEYERIKQISFTIDREILSIKRKIPFNYLETEKLVDRIIDEYDSVRNQNTLKIKER